MNVHIFIIHHFIYLSILSSGFLISSEVNLLPPFKYSKNLPTEIEVSSKEMYKAMSECVTAIVDAIFHVLEQTPPNFAVIFLTEVLCLLVVAHLFPVLTEQ